MAKEDARYTGSFFNSYTNTRMKLYRHCVPLDNDAEKIAEIYGYSLEEVERIFSEMDRILQDEVELLKEEFGEKLYEKLKNRPASFVFIGDQMTSECLSYYNILKRLFAEFPEIKLSIAGNTGDTSNQSLQYIYGLAVSQEPTVTSILIGTNDAFCGKDAFVKTISSREEFRDNVDYLTKVMLHTGSKVVLNTLPPVEQKAAEHAYAHMNWTISNDEIEIRNRLIYQIAEKNQCALNDIAAVLREIEKPVVLDGNGVLLTEKAQFAIARGFIKVLLAQL
ncbi:hypothetical protein V1225_13315 [Emergencia sp. JLR.KK010]|jgi:lysophospholipase L1-like esterase|uniref:SGNH/GDSL hydrolase family protein n=1 Tax=Emergencia sp. JLR.KK010 TaxID=3114296 RepID=UPI0030CDF88A